MGMLTQRPRAMGSLMQTQKLGKDMEGGGREEVGKGWDGHHGQQSQAPQEQTQPHAHMAAAFGRQGIPEPDADGDGDGADGTRTLQNDSTSPTCWQTATTKLPCNITCEEGVSVCSIPLSNFAGSFWCIQIIPMLDRLRAGFAQVLL